MIPLEEIRNRVIEQMESGRGSSRIAPCPVSLEPPLIPLTPTSNRRSFFQRLFNADEEKQCNTMDDPLNDDNLRFLHIRPCREDKNSLDDAEQFILSLRGSHPIAYEVIGFKDNISFQIVAEHAQADLILSLMKSHFPGADAYIDETDLLKEGISPHFLSRAYRHKNSHFFPLGLAADSSLDPYRSLCGVLGNLREGQVGALQILFKPVTCNWPENIRRASRDPYDSSRSVFVDIPQLVKEVERKLEKPLYAVSIRMVAANQELLAAMQSFLMQFETGENGIVQIPGDYPVHSILARNTHVHGAILNASEISYFFHLPYPGLIDAVQAIDRATKSYTVPDQFTTDGPVLGYNLHRGIRKPVRHGHRLPNQHSCAWGKSGYGKSNAIIFSALQRIEASQGVGIIDPHGALICQDILPRIPKERVNDVVYFNAGDFDYPMAINPLAHKGTKKEKEHIRVDLLNFFEDLFESPLGVNVQHALNFIIVTLLNYPDSNLGDIERLLMDKKWRNNVLQGISDKRIITFWEQEFPLLEKRGIITTITNKLSPLLLPDSTIAPMLLHRENKIDFLHIMNNRKIFLCNLSHGDIGKRNSQLLGKLIISKIQIAAMMREGIGACPDFYLHIDEFQYMTTPSMADILSGGRKYGLHLWLTNQMIKDIPEFILRSVFNASTLIFFCTDTPQDQQMISRILSSKFKPEEVGQLTKGQTFLKMDSAVFNMETERVSDSPPIQHVQEIIELSRSRYAEKDTRTIESSKEKLLSLYETSASKVPLPDEKNNTDLPEGRSAILSPQEKVFLENIQNDPNLTITGLYKKAHLSSFTGDKLKRELVKKGYIQEVITHLGKGSRIAKFLSLTPDGLRVLGVQYSADDGKGGVLHKFWQQAVRNNAEGKGYRVIVEEPIPGSRETVDLALHKDGKRLGLEISITCSVSQETSNISKCLREGYDQVIILVLDEDKLVGMRSTVERNFAEQERKRISIGLIYGFGSFF